MVRQTLKEIYGREFEELNGAEESGSAGEEATNDQSMHIKNPSKNFYMCTTCGYRGNTSRGVKQHGKMHLNAREHFAIINTTPLKPYLVYNSLEDVNLASNSASYDSTHGGGGVKREIVESDESDEVKKTSHNNVESSGEIVTNTTATTTTATTTSSQHPFTKKARLLEYNANLRNQNRQQQEDEESEDDQDDSSAEQIKIERPQTFCHKCSTQFRQFSSFLAHKKFYCKDD